MSNPVLTISTSATYMTGGAAVTLSGSATVSDPGATNLVSASIHVSSGSFAGDGDVLAANVAGTFITASYNAATELLTLTGRDTIAHYQQVMDSLTFSSGANANNSGANPTRTIDWSVTDSNGAMSTVQQETVNITGPNQAPVLSNVAPTAFYGEHAAMVPISPGLRVSDNDGATLASAIVHVSAGAFAGDGDVLAANVAGTSISASYNSATETLTLTGTDTVAHYQQVLDGVTFQSTSNNPGNFGANTTRTIDWTVDDGALSNSTSTTLHTTITIVPLAVHQDFNADAMSDVLWRNSNGAIVEWALNGGNIAGSQQLATSPDPTTWSIAGIADFNHDREADILWRSTSGEVALWFMNGSAIIGSGDANSGGVAIKPDASWSVAGVGDLNGDRNADIIWRNTSGEVAVWFMNGSTITGSNDITNGGVAVKPGASWSVAGVGDVDGDGKRDLVWRDASSGEVAVWLMNGSAITSSADITNGGVAVKPDSSWSIAGVGDFNGDGKADVLWRNSSGALVEWLLNGNAISASLSIGTTPDSSWNIVEVGDFDGNGKSDILWRQTGTGTFVEWSMNSSAILSSGAVGVALDSTWQTQNKPTDFG